MTALAAYIAAHGPAIAIGAKQFTVEGISGGDDLAVATFRTMRATYMAVVAVRRDLVRGKPGAEVWSVISGKRTVCTFAVWNDTLIPLR